MRKLIIHLGTKFYRLIEFIKTLKRNQFLFFILIIIGLVFCIDHLTRTQIKSTNELVDIKGALRNFSFINEGITRYRYVKYSFEIIDNQNDFIIPEKFITEFNRKLFENSIKLNDTVLFKVLKDKLSGEMLVFSIKGGGKSFLNMTDTISRYNSIIILIIGLIFIAIGFIGLSVIYNQKLPPTLF
jgi:hypothetical protein